MSPITQEQLNEIIRLVLDGLPSDNISEKVGVSLGTIGSIKAHITMGTYEIEGAAEIEAAIETIPWR